jgi:hypothetical protein
MKTFIKVVSIIAKVFSAIMIFTSMVSLANIYDNYSDAVVTADSAMQASQLGIESVLQGMSAMGVILIFATIYYWVGRGVKVYRDMPER